MNIAKNHWVTLKCTVIVISLHLLVPVTFSFGTIFTAFYFKWTTEIPPQRAEFRLFLLDRRSDFEGPQATTVIASHRNVTRSS